MTKSEIKDTNLFVKGIIVDTNDPRSKARVKVRIPCYHGIEGEEGCTENINLPWAQTCLQTGNVFNVGDTVWVTFEGGDNRYPVIFGQLGSTATFTNENGGSSSGSFGIVGGEYDVVIDGNTYHVGGTTLAEYGVCLIKIHESGSRDSDIPDESYQAINGYDVNGPSIGFIQWHGSNAINLLKRIRNKNSSKYDELANSNGASTLISDLDSGTDWIGQEYAITKGSSIYNGLRAILKTDESKEIQNEMATEFVQSYIDLGVAAGISDNGALLYHADICNQGPYMNVCLAMRESSDKSLDNFYNISKNEWYDRRTLSYKIIKELQNLGALEGTGGVIDITISAEGWCWPVPSCKNISSPYGNRDNPLDTGSNEFHKGIDIPGASGASIVAANSGVVQCAEESGRAFNENGGYITGGNGYGNCTIIAHENGYYTLYGHQSSMMVKKGQEVSIGQTIGAVGNTGGSTGPHLHFEVRKSDGSHYDPQKFVSPNATAKKSTSSKGNKKQLQGSWTSTYYGNYKSGNNTKGGSGRILKEKYSCAINVPDASLFGGSDIFNLYSQQKEIYIECEECPEINGTYRIDDAGAGDKNIDIYYVSYNNVQSSFKSAGRVSIKVYV